MHNGLIKYIYLKLLFILLYFHQIKQIELIFTKTFFIIPSINECIDLNNLNLRIFCLNKKNVSAFI